MKKPKFIIVTRKDNGKPMLINPNAIELIHEDYSGKTDTVWIETGNESYGVLEGMDYFREILTDMDFFPEFPEGF